MIATILCRLTDPSRHPGPLQTEHRLLGILGLRPRTDPSIEGILMRQASSQICKPSV
jgi:hypothetical protein